MKSYCRSPIGYKIYIAGDGSVSFHRRSVTQFPDWPNSTAKLNSISNHKNTNTRTNSNSNISSSNGSSSSTTNTSDTPWKLIIKTEGTIEDAKVYR